MVKLWIVRVGYVILWVISWFGVDYGEVFYLIMIFLFAYDFVYVAKYDEWKCYRMRLGGVYDGYLQASLVWKENWED